MSVSEAQAAPAVALLARPGAARERLREALSHADVQLVLEDDPNGLEPQLLQDARPQFVVIALEAAIEDALERLEAVLSAPGLTLVFDEAELAARRDGWEAQRWGRHRPPSCTATSRCCRRVRKTNPPCSWNRATRHRRRHHGKKRSSRIWTRH